MLKQLKYFATTFLLTMGLSVITFAIVMTFFKTEQPQYTHDFIYQQFDPTAKEKHSSLVRLERGYFFCSGVVVSDTMLITAAHCVSNNFMGMSVLTEETMTVKSDPAYNPNTIEVTGTAIKANGSADFAIVQGDFRQFRKAKVTTDVRMLFGLSEKIVACGFPYGAESVCYPMSKPPHRPGNRTFSFGRHGYLYPGMSGGPVLDRETNTVFAVNSAMANDDVAMLAPLIGLWRLLKE